MKVSQVISFIKSTLQKQLKVILLTVFFTIFTFSSTSVFPTELAFAQDDVTTQTSTDAQNAISDTNSFTATYDATLQQVSSLLAVAVKAFNYLLWPILFLIGGLMDNSLIFGPGVEDRLYLIWSQIRNLINLLFAVILIGIAIYNVLGLSKDGNYSLKTFLPSMVVTLVLVNFSFFGVRFMLDMANVATTAVFALPNVVEQGLSEARVDTIQEGLCNNKALSEIRSTEEVTLANSTEKLCNGTIFSENGLAQFQSVDKNNMAIVMAISFNRIADVLDPSELTVSNPSLINLAINLIIVLILQIAYISAFFALFAVLVARVIAMWIVTIASPLLVLKLGMSKTNIPGLSFLDSFDLEKIFIQHATAPIKIGLAMSVGYMMLDVFQTVGSPSLYFPLGDDFSNVFSGVSSINELFVAVAAIAIVWKVSFDAADGTFADSITNKYRSWAQGIGISVRDLLIQKTPVIPLATGKDGKSKGMSIGDLGGGLSSKINDIGKKFDNIRGVNSSTSNSTLIQNLKANPVSRVIRDSDKSKLRRMDKDQLRVLSNTFMAHDDPAFQGELSRSDLKKDILPVIKEIRAKDVDPRANSELQTLISDIEASGSTLTAAEAAKQAGDILKKHRGVTGTYRKQNYDRDLTDYESRLNSN
jgi:hypothetical protein